MGIQSQINKIKKWIKKRGQAKSRVYHFKSSGVNVSSKKSDICAGETLCHFPRKY